MKIKQSILCGLLAVILAFTFTACPEEDNGGAGTAPAITTTTLPDGTVGTAYSQTLAAAGDAPITWSLESDSTLPAGLTLAENGAISGTPTTVETSSFTVKATNAAGSDSKTLSITIAPVGGGGGGDDGNGVLNEWWTWVSDTSTADISITPTEDNTGCDVSVTGTANYTWNDWTVVVACNYTAAAGKTYEATWKWAANVDPFTNVVIRYMQQKDYQDDYKYQLGTNTNRLTIPTSEKTLAVVFTLPADLSDFILNFTFFVGADTGSFIIRDFKIKEVTFDDDDDFVDLPLPASNGNNELSGKTYFSGLSKTTFATDGTYVRYMVDSGTYGPYGSGNKYTFNTPEETGRYSWDGTAKTVTFKPEKIINSAFLPSYGYSSDSSGNESFDSESLPLLNRTDIRSYIQTYLLTNLNSMIQEEGVEAINQWLSESGFSSLTAYVVFFSNNFLPYVNPAFSNQTYVYSSNTDGTLFLERTLPDNIGTNELSDQTYSAGSVQYSFTASGFTVTYSGETRTGSYAYDSSKKQVWLRYDTVNGKNREQYYADMAISGHNYPDDDTYRAAQTNSAFDFRFGIGRYDSTNKTIGN